MLVAVVLLTVGVLALAQANAATLRVGSQSANRGVALAIARAHVEVLRSRDPWTVAPEAALRVDGNGAPASDGAYTREVRVDVLRQNLIRLEVQVSYPNATGPVRIETLQYRPNGNNPQS
jgi:Tfp pilus assembly protein PilV